MTDLAQHQRAMLALLKQHELPPSNDSYIAELARSGGLDLYRKFVFWWRTLSLEANCPSTVHLLKHLNSFDELLQSFYASVNVSSYAERTAEQFLSMLCTHPELLVRSMAEFELALMQARQGKDEQWEIVWDRDPNEVFRRLASNEPLPPRDQANSYYLSVSRDLPELVSCVCVPTNARASANSD